MDRRQRHMGAKLSLMEAERRIRAETEMLTRATFALARRVEPIAIEHVDTKDEKRTLSLYSAEGVFVVVRIQSRCPAIEMVAIHDLDELVLEWSDSGYENAVMIRAALDRLAAAVAREQFMKQRGRH